MKKRRILSFFLLLTLLCSLLALPAAAAPIPEMKVAAKSALLVEADTGEILYAQDEHKELFPASLTKIMTALLVLEAVDAGKLKMDQKITVTATALSGLADDGSSAGIRAGEILTVHELLSCMLVVSANEACNILGEQVAGSVSAFVDQMNAKAKVLGCENTHFVNATGLHDSQHYTSAWDMYLMTKEARTHSDFMALCDTAQTVIPATNLSPERTLHTTNYLLSRFRAVGYTYSDAHGIKTGSTSDAGHCLVSSAVRGSRSMISVVMGAQLVSLPGGKTDAQSFSETSRLFDWGFKNFSRTQILKSDQLLAEVPVSLSRKVSYVTVHPERDVDVLLANDVKAEELEQTVKLDKESAEAPIKAGDRLGEVTIHKGKTVYATVPLLALDDVEASRLLTIQHKLFLFFAKPVVRIILVILAILIAVLIVWRVMLSRRRYRYGHKVTKSSNYHGRKH